MPAIFDDLHVVSHRGAVVYILLDGAGCILVDAGHDNTPRERIYPCLRGLGRGICGVVLTHGHADHYEGCRDIKNSSGARISIHREDAPLIRFARDYVLMKGLAGEHPGVFRPPGDPEPCTEADSFLEEGVRIRAGDFDLEVLHTPGHSPGSISLFDSRRKTLFSGDTAGGDTVHFYGRPGVFEASLKRLKGLCAETLLLGHAYPPAGKSVLSGAEVGEYLDLCLRRLDEASARARELYARSGEGLKPEDLVEDLGRGRVTKIAAIQLIRSVRPGGLS